ncbi:MAG: hypothetical protein K2J63_01225 [Muribaculaceae bacterium]|nr:hypothetical protein [Muribaculaceae bacterium]
MAKFVRLTKIEYDDVNKDFEKSELFINIDYVVYVESKVVHLSDGTSFLCKEDYDTIIAKLTE